MPELEKELRESPWPRKNDHTQGALTSAYTCSSEFQLLLTDALGPYGDVLVIVFLCHHSLCIPTPFTLLFRPELSTYH